MGSAVVKPLTRKRGKMKRNTEAVDPASEHEEQSATGSRETNINCKVNVLADSAKNLPQPFFGKPCKEDGDKTQSNRKVVCCTYVFFNGKGKAYDSDEELGQVQAVRKENRSPSQTKHNKQNGTNLSENYQKLHNQCLTMKCTDPISQPQVMQGDNGEIVLQPQVTQSLNCAKEALVCSTVNNIPHDEARSLPTYNDNTADQSQERLAVQDDTLQIRSEELADKSSMQDQHVSCEAYIELPEYDYVEEVKVVNASASVTEPYPPSPPLQSCEQSSETTLNPIASVVGVSSSKTKHSLELPCQQRLDIGDQVFIKPSPSVEYTKSQCRGAGECLCTQFNYSHNICLINSEVQKRCFQTLCQEFDLEMPKDSNSDYRCFSFCTNSPRVERNTSVNAANVTVKSEANETLECNENNAIYSSDSFGDVMKQSLLPDFANSSKTSLNRKATVMKCDKSSDSSSLNHPHVEDVLAVGEEFLDEIEEVFLQQNCSQFPCIEKGKCGTPVKETDAKLQTASKNGTLASPCSSCHSKHSDTNHRGRQSRPVSSAKPSTRSSGSVSSHVSTSKAIAATYHTSNELQPDIFIQEALFPRGSNTKQTLINSELEYGPGYIDDMLSKGGSIPSRACSSKESLHSTREALMQSIISDTLLKEVNTLPLCSPKESLHSTREALMQSITSSDTLLKEVNTLPLCSPKESRHSTKAVKSHSVTDDDAVRDDGNVPSADCSLKSILHNASAVPSQSRLTKEAVTADSKPPSKACSSNESLPTQRASVTQSVLDKEIMNRGSRPPSRLGFSKDSLHNTNSVPSLHFSNNEIRLQESRTSRPCSSNSSLKNKFALVTPTLNKTETPQDSTTVPKASFFHESLNTNRSVLPESLLGNEIMSADKGVLSTTCSSKTSLLSAKLVATQHMILNGETSKDCREPSRKCSSNESVQSSGTTQTNTLQNTMRKESMHPPRVCSSKESLQSVGLIQTKQPIMLTYNESHNVSSQRSSPRISVDVTALNTAPSNLCSRPPSSKRASSSLSNNHGRPRAESNKQSADLPECVQMSMGPRSHHSGHSLSASRPPSNHGSRIQPGLEVSVQSHELLHGSSVLTRTQKRSDSVQEAASFSDGSHQLSVKDSLESALTAVQSKSEVSYPLASNTCGSRSLQNSEEPAVTEEDVSCVAQQFLPDLFTTTVNRTVKSCSRSSMSSKTGVNDEPEEIPRENLATSKEMISPCLSSAGPPIDSLTSESTGGPRLGQAESRLAIDANSSAVLPAGQPYCLSPDKIGNIRRQLYEEGFKPAEREGGVAFFIPVTEDGLQPQADSAVVAERLTKTKKASLNYEERMFLANINRQVQLSKKKEFAVRDIRNVKGATSSSDGSDRTKQTDDVDEFDVSF